MLTGDEMHTCCHSNLTRAVLSRGLREDDVHDVVNVFMCTGFFFKAKKKNSLNRALHYTHTDTDRERERLDPIFVFC